MKGAIIAAGMTCWHKAQCRVWLATPESINACVSHPRLSWDLFGGATGGFRICWVKLGLETLHPEGLTPLLLRQPSKPKSTAQQGWHTQMPVHGTQTPDMRETRACSHGLSGLPGFTRQSIGVCRCSVVCFQACGVTAGSLGSSSWERASCR